MQSQSPKEKVNSSAKKKRKQKNNKKKKQANLAEGYRSAIACHLATNKGCRERYSEIDFKVLTRGRDKLYLSVLQDMYIYALEPVLCKQKLSVLTLHCFSMHTQVTSNHDACTI